MTRLDHAKQVRDSLPREPDRTYGRRADASLGRSSHLHRTRVGQGDGILSELGPQEVRRLRRFLQQLHESKRLLYDALFLNEEKVQAEGTDFSLLERAGLAHRIEGRLQASVRVFEHRGRFVVTDFTSSPEWDRVFQSDEAGSGYLADRLGVCEGDRVLDLGTGSGILSLFCAEKAKHVVATDVNPKALAYAQFNARLNGVDDKIEFRQGNLFEAVPLDSFDLIVANPPPVPVPPGTPFFLHSDGGPDGLRVFEEILSEAPGYLREELRMQFVMLSLVGKRGPLLATLLQDRLGRTKTAIKLTPLYPSPVALIPDFFSLFEHSPGFAEWSAGLDQTGLHSLDCYHISVRAAPSFRMTVAEPNRSQTAFCWRRRFRKYAWSRRTVTSGTRQAKVDL